jgi:putative DNA primase/helicase
LTYHDKQGQQSLADLSVSKTKALRKARVALLREGTRRERELARVMGSCAKGHRCRSVECPECERLRHRRARRERAAQGACTERPAPGIVMVRTSAITPEKIDWIWPGIIVSGRATGLVGYPGLGKSQAAIDFAATVSTGRAWPGGAANSAAAQVIILSAEDDLADTIVPRLIAAGADRERVSIVTAVKDGSVERPFNLAVDLDRLEKEFDLRQVRLLIIDPVSAYLGTLKNARVNRNNGGDVRAIQDRLALFAARHELAIVAVSHLNKSTGARAITRIMGSLEWVAAPRAVFLVTEEAGTDRRLFLPLKNNLAPDRIGYAFRIEDRIVADGIGTSSIVWDQDPITISAEEALAAAARRHTPGAVDFLQQALSDGPIDQTEIIRLGKEAGFTEKTLRAAREKLGVKPTKEGFGEKGKWVWVPSNGATLLKLVVDNDPNKQSQTGDESPPESTGSSGVDEAAESTHVHDVGNAAVNPASDLEKSDGSEPPDANPSGNQPPL